MSDKIHAIQTVFAFEREAAWREHVAAEAAKAAAERAVPEDGPERWPAWQRYTLACERAQRAWLRHWAATVGNPSVGTV